MGSFGSSSCVTCVSAHLGACCTIGVLEEKKMYTVRLLIYMYTLPRYDGRKDSHERKKRVRSELFSYELARAWRGPLRFV